jgi:hypothetical protein
MFNLEAYLILKIQPSFMNSNVKSVKFKKNRGIKLIILFHDFIEK